MRRAVAAIAAALGLMAFTTAPAGAESGPTIEQLRDAGWLCVRLATGMHCLPPGADPAGPGLGLNAIYFDPVTDEFAGTELVLLTSRDLTGQPCHGHPDGIWHFVGFGWACHHPSGGH